MPNLKRHVAVSTGAIGLLACAAALGYAVARHQCASVEEKLRAEIAQARSDLRTQLGRDLGALHAEIQALRGVGPIHVASRGTTVGANDFNLPPESGGGDIQPLAGEAAEAFDQGVALIETAQESKRWTDESAEQLRGVLSYLSMDQRGILMSMLAESVNRAEIRLETNGPPF